MTPAPYCSSVYITAAIVEALESGNVRESDYLLLDEEHQKWYVGQMGVSDDTDLLGFDINLFVDFADKDFLMINDDAVNALSWACVNGLF